VILALSEGGCAVLRLILSPIGYSLGLNVQSELKGDHLATRDIGLVSDRGSKGVRDMSHLRIFPPNLPSSNAGSLPGSQSTPLRVRQKSQHNLLVYLTCAPIQFREHSKHIGDRLVQHTGLPACSASNTSKMPEKQSSVCAAATKVD
jgi:hypothetical protein